MHCKRRRAIFPRGAPPPLVRITAIAIIATWCTAIGAAATPCPPPPAVRGLDDCATYVASVISGGVVSTMVTSRVAEAVLPFVSVTGNTLQQILLIILLL